MAAANEDVRRIDGVGLRHIDAVVDPAHPGGELAAHGHAGGEHVRAAIHRGDVGPFLGWDAEGRVAHAQRLEQSLAQEHSERPARDDFYDSGGDVDADAVAPAGPGLERKRKLRQIVDDGFQRMVRS